MKTCKQCAKPFEITESDRAFYAKINVPEPTQCPQCRLIRRMLFRNDRTFYNRTCDKTGKTIISIYPQDVAWPVYESAEWYKDDWNAMDYGQDFDFNRPFFDQWKELRAKVPKLSLDIVNCENSDYCNYCGDDKNCYLDIAGEANEDCYYNLFTKYSKNCADCTFTYNSELCYESINCYRCHSVRFSMYLENCHDCNFCFDLKGCSDCFFSFNLRQKKYHIFNQPHSKEEYEQKIKELQTGSYKTLQTCIAQWKKMLESAIHRDMYNLNSENCTGNNIKNSKNCHESYNIVNCEDGKYLYDVLDAKDCYDLNYSLYDPEASYELMSSLSMKFSAFSMASHHNSNVFYCDQCNNASDLFGCIGLTQKKYCILNKQYTKEEYENLKTRIIEHMKKTGEWGEFFPPSLAAHGYNETVAQEYFPITQEEAEKNGYPWKETTQKAYRAQAYTIPDHIKDVPDTITNELLACVSCSKNFKVIAQEVDLYRRVNVPLPRKCPDCRHRDRIALRNPRKLNENSCTKCQKKVTSTYPSEKAVYCETCYHQAIH